MNADPLTATYTNNRRTDQYWGYDADGRNTANEDFYSYYDAAGRRYLSSGNLEITQTFDGNGQRLKQTEDNGSGVNVKKRYYVNSTVLGTIYEIEFISTTNWKKKVGMVYLNGQQIAIQNTANNNTQTVWWSYENPVTGAMRGTLTNMASEPDPLGVNNGLAAPPPEPPEYPDYVPDFILPSRIVDPSNMTNGCQWGGLPISCDSATELANEESRIKCSSEITSGNSWSLDNMQQTTENARRLLQRSHIAASGTGIGFGNTPNYIIIPGSNQVNPEPDTDDNLRVETIGTMDRYVFSFMGGSLSKDHPTIKGFPCPPSWKSIIEKGGLSLISGLSQTWLDANKNNQEEGGWIYMDKKGNVKLVRQESQGSRKQTGVLLGSPPVIDGFIVIANFHTHDSNAQPSESVPGFVTGDIDINESRDKIPGLILGNTNFANENGVRVRNGEAGFFTFAAGGLTYYGPETGFFKNDLPKRCRK